MNSSRQWRWHAADRLRLLSLTAILLFVYHNLVEDGFRMWMLLLLPLLFVGLPQVLRTRPALVANL